MSHISRLPLPSISLVLTTDHTRIPRRPSVVKVAPLSLPVTEVYNAQFDPMKTVHVRNVDDTPPFEEASLPEKCGQNEHVVFVEEVESEDFTLAESMHEDCAHEERISIGKTVKRTIARALFSVRQVFRVELPCNTCFRRPRRK